MRMSQRLKVLLSLIIIYLLLQSHYYQYSYNYISEYKKAERIYNSENATDKTDSIAFLSYLKTITFLEKTALHDSILFDSYVKAGIISMTRKKDSLALHFFLKSLSLKISSQLPDSLFFKSYLFTGTCYYTYFDLDSALFYFKQAENLLQKYPTLNEAERLYNKTGVLYYESGDYKKSILYFSKALSLLDTTANDNGYFILNYKNNIASALRKLQKYDQALTLYKSLLSYDINKNELLHNIGVTYLDAGDYSEAIRYLKQVKYNNQAINNDLGRVYWKMARFDSAMIYFNNALLQHRSSGKTQKNFDYGITLKYMGDLFASKQMPLQALENYQQAIIQLDPDFNDTSLARNPVSFNGLHQYIFLFDAMLAKARAFNKLITDRFDLRSMVLSLDTYRATLELARHIERFYESDEARLFLKKNVDTAFHEFVDQGLKLYEITKDTIYMQNVFNAIENNKASILQTDLHELELSKISGLPVSLIQQEKNIKKEITRLNIQLALFTNDSSLHELTFKIRNLELALAHLQHQLDDDPKYNTLKFSNRNVLPADIQSRYLKKDDAIISFYYTGQHLICFFITQNKFGYVSSTRHGQLTSNILRLRQFLNYDAAGNRKTVDSLSIFLYSQLIEPVIKQLTGVKHLLIIPYNEISYVPFEILKSPAEQNILLKDFAIRYDYSINFLSRNRNTDNIYKVLAIAPFTDTIASQDLQTLSASRDEVKDLNGKVLMGKDATKGNFIQFSDSYPIVHLATHAIANDSLPMQSFIAFYNVAGLQEIQHRLYEQEIYNLDMSHVRLVILSACETGSGQLVNGEGIMSLSRAFSFAGCKSVLASLWKADDAATASITRRMHHYLQNGDAKDIALQKAKIDYLNDKGIDERHKIPSYWSHLILIGDGQPVSEKNYILYFVAGGGLILLMLRYVYYRKVKWW